MSDRSYRWLGWTQVCLGFLLALVFMPALGLLMLNSGQRDFSGMPAVGRAELIELLDRSEASIKGKPGERIEDYFDALVMVAESDLHLEKYLAEHPDDQNDFLKYGIPGTNVNRVGMLQDAYLIKFGGEAFRRASETTGANERMNALYKSVDVEDERIWPAFRSGLIASVLVAMLFFMARVASMEGMLVWPELPKIFVYAFAWPAMVWKYPTEVSPREQIKRLRRWVAWLIASLLPVVTMGVASAQKKTEPAYTSDNVYVIDPETLPPKVAFTVGLQSAKVAGNGFTVGGPIDWAEGTATYGNGVSVDVWASRERSGTGASDETDFSVAQTWKMEDATATAGIALFDIRPLGKGKGGDILSPFASIGWQLGGMDAFAKAEAYYLTGGDKGRNGMLLSGGVSDSLELGGLTFDYAASLAYGQGPFSQDDGLAMRLSGSASMPLGERIRVKLLELKAWRPMIGARDRSPAFSVGASISYAH